MKARQYHEFRRNIQPNIIELEEYGDSLYRRGIALPSLAASGDPISAMARQYFSLSSLSVFMKYTLGLAIFARKFMAMDIGPPSF